MYNRNILCILLSFLLISQSGCYAPKVFTGNKQPKEQETDKESLSTQSKLNTGYTVRIIYLDDNQTEQTVEGDIEQIEQNHLVIRRSSDTETGVVIVDGIPQVKMPMVIVMYEAIKKIEILDKHDSFSDFVALTLVGAAGVAVLLYLLVLYPLGYGPQF